jgi:hypothetical protein
MVRGTSNPTLRLSGCIFIMVGHYHREKNNVVRSCEDSD